MKTNKKISKLVTTAVMAVIAAAPSYAQTNIGVACGCPPLASRPTVSLSTLPNTVLTTTAGTQGFELTNSVSLTCDKTWILDGKIYVAPGKVMNIQPGTVIKALAVATPSNATALVIERGAKIIANGTDECPIVFTALADPMDGTYSYANKGQWGGLVILGKATNNLSLAANGPYVAGGAGKLAVADGLGTIEGFATTNPQDRYGANISGAVVAGEPAGAVAFDDNDNSGILRFVSVRFSGAVLAVGAEINGITLGSVGRGTTIDHVEIIASADDNIEFFGGTVDVKYVSALFGNDDMFDYDLGWSGRAQFLFGMKGNTSFSADSDNGYEADSDDQKSNNLPKAKPVCFNATFIGNPKTVLTSDNSSIAAINAKEATGGEIYNSIFANFKNGLNLVNTISGTRAVNQEAYHNWTNTVLSPANPYAGILKVKCNTFVGVTNPLTVNSTASLTTAADNTQFTTTDNNIIVAGNTLAGFDYNFVINGTTNGYASNADVIPAVSANISTAGCPTTPIDGFFSATDYRGAFNPNGENWLNEGTYSALIGSVKGLAGCPTDLDKDGDTDIDDYLKFLPEFGTLCPGN